jgi:hypothetical protein
MDSLSIAKKDQVLVGYNIDDIDYSNISCGKLDDNLDCHLQSNLSSCFTKEVCKNKNYYNELKNLQINHSSANGRYYDTTNLYQSSFQNAFNLGIGIIGASTAIFIFS